MLLGVLGHAAAPGEGSGGRGRAGLCRGSLSGEALPGRPSASSSRHSGWFWSCHSRNDADLRCSASCASRTGGVQQRRGQGRRCEGSAPGGPSLAPSQLLLGPAEAMATAGIRIAHLGKAEGSRASPGLQSEPAARGSSAAGAKAEESGPGGSCRDLLGSTGVHLRLLPAKAPKPSAAGSKAVNTG